MHESHLGPAKIIAAKQLLVATVMLFIQITVFFVSAGHIAERSWIFFSASFLHNSLSTVVQYKLNPELLAVRLKRKWKGFKLWDELLMRVTNLIALIAVPAFAGVDVGRFHWLTLDSVFVVVGLVLFLFSSIFLNWAMAVNPHFEPTVRIQKDRGHKVITAGPYKVVRHPGYLAGIFYIFSIPLTVGSVFAFIPVSLYIILIIIRTSLEERTLGRQLDGYDQYAEKVRYRLFPGLW